MRYNRYSNQPANGTKVPIEEAVTINLVTNNTINTEKSTTETSRLVVAAAVAAAAHDVEPHVEQGAGGLVIRIVIECVEHRHGIFELLIQH